MISRAMAAQARSSHVRHLADRPSQRRNSADPAGLATVRAQFVRAPTTTAGEGVLQFEGYASVTEVPYDMWDMWGPYTEIVSAGAFGATLLAKPEVEFTLNHGAGGAIPMAHTRNETLVLAEDVIGFKVNADMDPRRTDVQNVVLALDRGDLSEMSFKFRIDNGTWSPDYTEFRINAVDLNRGDASIVNFGANPWTYGGMVEKAQVSPITDLDTDIRRPFI